MDSTMLANPQFWVAVAFAVFFLLFGKKLFSFMFGALDDRSARIARELKEAESIRAEAEGLLAEYKAKYQDSMQEAEQIVARARESAKEMAVQAERDMQAMLARRLKQAEQRIQDEEMRAVAQVRDRIVDITVSAARRIVQEKLAQSPEDPAVRGIIASLEQKVH